MIAFRYRTQQVAIQRLVKRENLTINRLPGIDVFRLFLSDCRINRESEDDKQKQAHGDKSEEVESNG